MGYNKFSNKKVIVDGIKFDSQGEARRYSELKILKKAGLIANLKMQVEFELIPAFTQNGKKYRKTSYFADFVYLDIEKEVEVVEDFKGFRTDVYKIKKKMLLWKYPHINFKESSSNQKIKFKKEKKQLKKKKPE